MTGEGVLKMVARKAANRYPREGECLAPLALRDILAQPASKHLQAQLGETGLMLCDLDESVWQRYPSDVVKQLGRAVLARVSNLKALKAVGDRMFPRLSPGLKLDDL